VTLNYDVIDGNGGSAQQSATITITGVNDAPVVGDPLELTLSEQDAATALALLQNASDPDTSDTLSVTGLVIDGDNGGAVQQDGSSVSIDPNAYDSLNAGESAVITLTYQVTDGTDSVPASATITITGVDDDPVVAGPIERTFDERDRATTVSLLEGASDPNNDPLFIVDPEIVSGDARGVTVNVGNSTLEINPRAYTDLEDGESATVVIEYQVSDDEGNTTPQTATITITGRTIIGSTISGELFVDYIENPEEVRQGEAPVRNGNKDDDEQSLGGVTVRLLQVTPDGEVEVDRVMTDNDGRYTFEEVLGGTYYVQYDVPESVRYTGTAKGMVVVDEFGGESLTGPKLDAIGLVGVQQRLDLLAKTYIAQGIIDTSLLTEGLAGGSAHLNADGTQAMFIEGLGFDTEGVGLDAEFAQITLNQARDAALLTILDSNGAVHSARLSYGQFVVAGNGEGVRFFGRLEDLDFGGTPQDQIEAEFSQYRSAVDRLMAAGL
jgi:VCBS repeat-containing protein